MATKRVVVGAVLKDKDNPKKSYIKFNRDVTFKEGDCLSVESKEDQLESLESAIAQGKISADLGAKIKERINNIKPFVRFELIKREAK